MARYALVVGIAQYKAPLLNLSKPTTDAEVVAQRLREHGDFQQVELIKEQPVTGGKLGKALQTFLLKQAVNSEALIYFTGHGITVTDNLGLQEGYLATSDCAITIDGSKQITAQKGGIALASLNGLIRQANLSSLVVLLDCCHSGDFLERNLVEQTLTAFSSRKDYYLITACRGFQLAYAMKSEQHSIFTEAMLNGLSSENAGNDGQVSGDRLFDFIATQLKGSGQEPIRMGWGRSITLVKYQTQIPAVASVIREECPYQGLKAFQKQQAEFFFGRKRVIEDIRQKLELASFVPIIGASGSGKSSVVRAGLIPWLEESGWQLLGLESSELEVGLEPIRPGIEPLGELKRALARPFKLQESTNEVRQVYEFLDNYQNGSPQIIEQLADLGRFLLVVDQFEEVFTLCPKEEERRRFIDLLTQLLEISASRLAVVITMRADFLEPCLKYASLTHLIQTQAVYMPPLSGADLEEAIASPARLQGYHFEDGLLGEILKDVGQEQGTLPLLQFALTELWEKRDRQQHLLTLQQYKDLGGVIGALDRHAEQIYIRQGEWEKEWIKRIFLKLVRTGEGVKDTRQRQAKAKLLAIAGNNLQERQAISNVLDKLIQKRLLVTGQEAQQGEAWIDLAHEALMEGWQRFADWRQENRKLRRLIDRVEDTRQEWLNNQKNEKYLMTGGLLDTVREHWSELEQNVDSTTKEFFARSNAQPPPKQLYLTFRKPVNPLAAALAFKRLVDTHPKAGLEVVAMENTSEDKFLIRVKTVEGVIRSQLHDEYCADYKQLKRLPLLLSSEKDAPRTRSLKAMIETALKEPPMSKSPEQM